MARATFNDAVIADSDRTIVVEGNHYFPPESVRREYLTPSDHHTVCSWKGTASYYSIEVGDEQFENGAWTYPEPLPGASEITDYVAFYRNRIDVDA